MMAFVKSLTNIRSRTSVQIIKRCFSGDSRLPSQHANLSFLDETSSRDSRCTKGGHHQHWIECPKPIVIRPKLTMTSGPFVKRKNKPTTAVKCTKIRNCDYSYPTPKQCKFAYRQECERVPAPCPAFSEILRFKPIPELTECVCQSTATLPSLRFGYNTPCFDPREGPGERITYSKGAIKNSHKPKMYSKRSPHGFV